MPLFSDQKIHTNDILPGRGTAVEILATTKCGCLFTLLFPNYCPPSPILNNNYLSFPDPTKIDLSLSRRLAWTEEFGGGRGAIPQRQVPAFTRSNREECVNHRV